MLAVLNRDVQFTDLENRIIEIPKDTVVTVDSETGIAYYLDFDYHFDLDEEEYNVLC